MKKGTFFAQLIGFTLVFFASSSLADGGWNCDSPYQGAPQKYVGVSYNTPEWKACYLDSAVAQCQAGRVVGPHITCSNEALNASIILGYEMNQVHTICEQMNKAGYLPEGVSETVCEKDWKTYAA